MVEMKINNIDISRFGARLYTFKLSGTSFTKETGSTDLAGLPPVLNNTLGCKKLSVSLVFKPKLCYSSNPKKSIQAASKQKSGLELILLTGNSPLEIQMPDGYLYLADLTAISDSEYDTEIVTEYTFNAVKCLKPVTHLFSDLKINDTVTFNCISQLKTYCSLILTPYNSDIETVTLSTIGKVGFKVGMDTCIDGIEKTVKTAAGVNVMGYSTFTDFPTVNSGANSITITSAKSLAGVELPEIVVKKLTVKYYPVFA